MQQIEKLQNGLPVITQDIPYLDSSISFVIVGAGSRYETKEKNGIAHFAEHMLFKGSARFPSFRLISNLIDSKGGSFNAGTSKEYIIFWIKSPSSQLELSTDILSSILKEPLLKEEEIEREKGPVIREMSGYEDNPADYVDSLYERLQFGDTPLGWDIGGDKRTIATFRRDDIINYMDSLYSPKNMVLVYVGKLPGSIFDVASRYFTDLPERSYHQFIRVENIPQPEARVNIAYKKTGDADLILGVEGFDRFNNKKITAEVLSAILGECSSSRLFYKIRDLGGLSYGITTNHLAYSDTGVFTVQTAFSSKDIKKGLRVIKNEIEQISSEKVSGKELSDAKEMIKGAASIAREQTNYLAQRLAEDYLFEKRIISFKEYNEQVDGVSADDVLDVAQMMFKKENFNLQIAGPFKDIEPFKKILSP